MKYLIFLSIIMFLSGCSIFNEQPDKNADIKDYIKLIQSLSSDLKKFRNTYNDINFSISKINNWKVYEIRNNNKKVLYVDNSKILTAKNSGLFLFISTNNRDIKILYDKGVTYQLEIIQDDGLILSIYFNR